MIGICTLLCSILAIINTYVAGSRVEMFTNNYGHYLLFVSAAFLGIYAVLQFSRIIEGSFPGQQLAQMGKKATYLYGAQLPLFSLYSIYVVPSAHFYVNVLLGFVASVAVFVICMCLYKPYMYVLNKILNRV